MRRRTRLGPLAGAALLAATPGAMAADIALMVNGSQAGGETLAFLAEALQSRGYEVIDRSGADRDGMLAALDDVAARLPEAERLILVFAGSAQTAGPRAWLLPESFEGAGRIAAAREGVALDLLLDIAAVAPGRSAVVVAETGAQDGSSEADGPLGLVAGVGAPQVPQGVLVIAGPLEDAAQLVTDALLSEPGGVAAGLAEAPSGVASFGFRAPEAAFVNPAPAAVAPPPERAEEGTSEARAEPAPAVDAAEAAETAMVLDQGARREIQERLTVLGYNTRGIDGIFGPGTRAAIAEWQGDQNLDDTGFVGPEQLKLLSALADARSAELAAAAEAARREEEAADAAFWRTTGANGGAADLRAYLGRYPDGVYAREARVALDALEAEARAEAAEGDRAAWQTAEAEDRQRSYRAYLEAYPQGAFAGQAEARIAALRDAPKREQADKAAAAAEQGLGLARGSRALIEGQLAAIGYDVGAPDGDFDDRTRRALREFQTRQGLAVSGYVDQSTIQALIVASLGLR